MPNFEALFYDSVRIDSKLLWECSWHVEDIVRNPFGHDSSPHKISIRFFEISKFWKLTNFDLNFREKEFRKLSLSLSLLSSNRVYLSSTCKGKCAIFDSLSFHEFSRFFQNLRYPKMDILGIHNRNCGRSNRTRIYVSFHLTRKCSFPFTEKYYIINRLWWFNGLEWIYPQNSCLYSVLFAMWASVYSVHADISRNTNKQQEHGTSPTNIFLFTNLRTSSSLYQRLSCIKTTSESSENRHSWQVTRHVFLIEGNLMITIPENWMDDKYFRCEHKNSWSVIIAPSEYVSSIIYAW